MTHSIKPKDVLDFWQNAGPKKWWMKNADFDSEILEKFGALNQSARAHQLDAWRDSPDGCLALIITLDQFSRNLFRNSPKAFSSDPYALEVAKYGVSREYDKSARPELTAFFYLPYMHSENLDDQNKCVALFKNSDHQDSMNAALEHQAIIEKFGRFPHRNAVLGRTTTREEKAFLEGGGFAG